MSSPDDTADAEPLPLEFFQTLVEQSGDGIIMADERGVLRVFNPEAERQHGARKRVSRARLKCGGARKEFSFRMAI